jgi:hypothetical protein
MFDNRRFIANYYHLVLGDRSVIGFSLAVGMLILLHLEASRDAA